MEVVASTSNLSGTLVKISSLPLLDWSFIPLYRYTLFLVRFVICYVISRWYGIEFTIVSYIRSMYWYAEMHVSSPFKTEVALLDPKQSSSI